MKRVILLIVLSMFLFGCIDSINPISPIVYDDSIVGDWSFYDKKDYTFTNTGIWYLYSNPISYTYGYEVISSTEGNYWNLSDPTTKISFTYNIDKNILTMTVGGYIYTLHRF